MKIAIIGGHMAPAIGFLESLPKNIECIYIGREHVFEGDTGGSLEMTAVRTYAHVRFIPFQSGRIQRILTSHTLPSLLKIPKGFQQAFMLLKKEKPDIVVGFGGYLSLPLGIAAALLRIPLVIHESTLEVGLANKFLASFATKICISWDSSRQFFPKNKTVLTGDPLLPLHKDAKDIPLPVSREKLPLLVISGGSGGSHTVNNLVLQILPELLEMTKILHLTGDAREYGDFEKLIKKKESLPSKLQKRYSIVKFIDPQSINTAFYLSDVVIGRSGINTITTLLTLQKKAICIPLSFGQKNEQFKNAQLLESAGLGMILSDKTLSPKNLFQAVKTMLAKKIVSEKWQIPVVKNGAENLKREVLACLPASPIEK